MLFNSLDFLIFFPVVAIFFFAVPHRFRWILLLVASYYFYMSWNPFYIVLLIFSTAVSYFSAIAMSRTTFSHRKKMYFAASVLCSLGLLFAFKYYNFFNNDVLRRFMGFSLPKSNLLLPVGISFFTFQTLSYTIDVFRGARKPERHFGIYALYVSFFPQLVAGPIERSTRLLPQFYERVKFDSARVTSGLRLMLWGLFQKVVIADRLASFVDAVYRDPRGWPGISLTLATVLFGFQIYCDFAAYSEMAIGAARILGYDLMQNFKRPYLARSLSEFWQRWHISLSTWLRDYLFLPIAFWVAKHVGPRRPMRFGADVWAYFIGISITMFLGGLWHGASWNFAIWGILHGSYLVFGRATSKVRKRIYRKLHIRKKSPIRKFLGVSVTFALVQFAWIFFRAENLDDAVYIVKRLFVGWGAAFASADFFEKFILFGKHDYEFAVAMVSLAILGLGRAIEEIHGDGAFLRAKNPVVRWSLYLILLLGIVLFKYTTDKPFIYFQF